MPILKQLVSGSSQTKRRSRMDLTREMISSPLGDFRHTMHVGRSGDAFGDTSFLSSRSGEPPPPEALPAYPHSPRPGLLSRTFRSSKRSQSVSRVDQHHHRDNAPTSPGGGSIGGGSGSPAYVKNAMSLPFLNDCVDGAATTKSLTSSPLRRLGEPGDGRVSNGNGAAAAMSLGLELDERSFGELTELPESTPSQYRGGMKRAESVMSFHIDLGPSMLGDILDVMEKEDDDLGYEEGKSSEGHASPPLSAVGDGDDSVAVGGHGEAGEPEVEEGEEEEEEEEEEEADLQHDSMHAGSSVDLGPESGGPYTLEPLPKHLQHPDSCSMSSSGSAAAAATEGEKAGGQNHAADADGAPPEEESTFSSFLEDEDDEIRV
ncbi:unnamed protein product [Merluccius merluccius]